jgi:hypothetical protein
MAIHSHSDIESEQMLKFITFPDTVGAGGHHFQKSSDGPISERSEDIDWSGPEILFVSGNMS